ncbi:MAG: hypothetical protein HC828_12690 [Blastochloris sp.]|nr:hypothetical protein [Blastochloris sp.]
MTKQQRRPRRANVRELSYNEQFKMDTARVLIQERHYDEALALLRTVDHPLARRWETKLGARRRRRNTSRRTTMALLAFVALTLFVMAVVFGALFVRNQTSIDVEQGTVVAAVATFSRIAEDATGIVPTTEAELSARSTAAAATSAALDVSVAAREADATIAASDALATEAAVTATQFARDVDATQFTALQSAEVTLGSPDNLIPAQSPISGAFESGELRLLSAQRPSGYVLYADTRIVALPADETILGLEIGFVCPAALDVCPRVPSTALVLADGQTINESLLNSPDAPRLVENVRGGDAISGWRFYRVPRAAAVASVLVVDPTTNEWRYAGLPTPTDGYTVETAWSEPANGARTRRLPAFQDVNLKREDICWTKPISSKRGRKPTFGFMHLPLRR